MTLRIAHVGPVATSIPPPKSGSVQDMTSLLTEGLVARGLDVTLFGTGDSTTRATLHATFPHGYWHDEDMWPWELYEMLNLAAAIERAHHFDVIHYEAAYYPMSLAFTRLSPTPIVQTLHHAPTAAELQLWAHYPEARFIAISNEQAAAPLRVQRRRHRAARHRYRPLPVPRAVGRLSAVPRAVHRRQGAVLRPSRSPGASACG